MFRILRMVILAMAITLVLVGLMEVSATAEEGLGAVEPLHLKLKDERELSPETVGDREQQAVKEKPPRSWEEPSPFMRTREWRTIGTWTAEELQFDIDLEDQVIFNIWWMEDDQSSYDAQTMYRWNLYLNGESVAFFEDEEDNEAQGEPKEWQVQTDLNISRAAKGDTFSVTIEYRAFEDIFVYYDNVTYDSGVCLAADAIYFMHGSTGGGQVAFEFVEAWPTKVGESLEGNYLRLFVDNSRIDNGQATIETGPEYVIKDETVTAWRVTWEAEGKDPTLAFSYTHATSDYAEPLDIEVTDMPGGGLPTAIIDYIAPSPANEGEQVSFAGSGEDPDGYIAGYLWSSSLDGELSSEDAFTTPALSAGDHLISFAVKDDEQQWSNEVVELLHINALPTATIDSISPSPAVEGQAVRFQGTGSDSDGSVVGYHWESSLDGELSSMKTFSISSLTLGDHLISFQVQDDSGGWSALVTTHLSIIANAHPTAIIEALLPAQPNEGDPVEFQGGGTDPDGTLEAYLWRSNLDGQLSLAESFTASYLTPGTHTIYFKVQDNLGAWSEEVWQTIRVNQKPTANIYSIKPATSTEGEAISLLGFGSDQDGTVVAYEWRSDLDGVFGHEAALQYGELSVGEHTIYLRVQDDSGAWSPESVLIVTVEEAVETEPGGPDAVVLLGLVAGAGAAAGGTGLIWHLRRRGPGEGASVGPEARSGPALGDAATPAAIPAPMPTLVVCPHCTAQLTVSAGPRPMVMGCGACGGQLQVA